MLPFDSLMVFLAISQFHIHMIQNGKTHWSNDHFLRYISILNFQMIAFLLNVVHTILMRLLILGRQILNCVLGDPGMSSTIFRAISICFEYFSFRIIGEWYYIFGESQISQMFSIFVQTFVVSVKLAEMSSKIRDIGLPCRSPLLVGFLCERLL